MVRRVLIAVAAACALVPLFTASSYASSADIVLTASHATTISGHWTRVADATAAGGEMLTSTDTGWQSTSGASAAPTHFIDFSFTPAPNTPYRVWLRLRARGGSKHNDSVFVQFSSAVDSKNTARYRIGTTAALLVNRQRCDGCAQTGWGWYDGAYWLTQTSVLMFPEGPQTLRVQTREDGVEIDQIVLSPATYLATPPGPMDNDNTIVPVPTAPYAGAHVNVPGIVAAHQFDQGGQGWSWWDSTYGNAGVPIRATDVDIFGTATDGYYIGDTTAGEWMDYSIDVATAGEYLVRFEVAAATASTRIAAQFRDAQTDALSVPATGSVPAWTSVSTVVSLTAGQQVMRVVIDAGGLALKTIRIEPKPAPIGPALPPNPSPPPPAPPDIVLTASHASQISGHWSRVADATATGGEMLASTDTGWQRTAGALAAPTHFVDFTFTPAANTPYRVWLRLRALGGSKFNDSVFVQFSNAVDATNTPRYRIGTTSALLINRQRCDGCAQTGWGWYDGAYWLVQPATLSFPEGTQTLRIQTREDGVQIDQIVLSPMTYLTAAPGPPDNDATIVPVATRAFAGAPAAVPGTVAAHEFDEGAQGWSWFDTTPGSAGAQVRSTDVDIFGSSSTGYYVSDTVAGEWLDYSIRVAADGDYIVRFEVAAATDGARLAARFPYAQTASLAVPSTGGVPTWTQVSTVIGLAAGDQVMRVLIDAGGVALKHVSFEPVPTFTTFHVPAGGDLQAAINAAVPGDLILLAAGATYVGNYVLPPKGDGVTDYITIRSSAPDSLLPASDQRITPAYSALLPKLRSPNTQPALATRPYASHYRVQFVEFEANYQGFGNIIALGDATSAQNTLAVVPHHLIFDRVLVRGDVTYGQKRGIALNSAHTSIVNSYIAEIKGAGQDTQAIAGWNGPGPYVISNNYLEAAGENVMFGGADPAIPDLVPSDITFTHNHLFKPLSWRGSKWTIKNLFELKSAQRVLIDSNLMENNWLAAQTGFAVLLKSVNQDGKAPWSVVQDVTFTNNVIRNVASAINILGRDTRYPALVANNIVIRNNLFQNVSSALFGGSGRFLQINGGADITIDHNTVNADGSSVVMADGNATQRFTFTNNVFQHQLYGIKGGGTAVGNGTLTVYFPNALFIGNVLIGGKASQYPAGNYFPGTIADVPFVNWAGGDFRLSPLSIYLGAASDGTNPGVDYENLRGAFRAVQ